MKRHPRTWIAAALAAAALTACGGGADTTGAAGASAAADASQAASGTITGCVIVDGIRYDDAGATVKVDDDPSAPADATLAALRLGMKVELRADRDGRASSVTVSSEVRGPIESLATNGFGVAGQTVVVSTDPAAPTVFENVQGLAGLAVGDRVEVHGTRDAAGAIVASRIERKDPSSPPAIRVVGTVAALDATAREFTLGGLTVRWDEATRIRPAAAALADGLRVAVWSDRPVTGNVLAARAIVVKRPIPAAGDDARIGGLVRDLDFAAKTFRVDGVEVDASAATFTKGTAADLANGRRVRVRGTFADGRLSASELRFVRDQGDAAVALTGVVSDFAALRFTVRGVPVDATGDAVVYRGGTAENLADGVLVRVLGRVDGDVVRPESVEFVTTEDGRARWLFGAVSGYDAASGAFRLMNLDARLSDSTTFRNADGTPATREEFGDGDRVQVRGAFVAGVFAVREVVFRPGASSVVDRVEGGAYEVDLAAGVFRLNGTVVRLGPATVFEGSRQNLRNGVRVEVQGVVVEGELVASRVEISGRDGDELARVRGLITDFVTAADFRVAGQRVDASGASFAPSGAGPAGLADGRRVEVRGTVADGVLTATRVEFE